MLIKIIFIGPMGAGKTTAIKTISKIVPLSTEAKNSNKDAVLKNSTTVAIDYGEVDIGKDSKLALYGMPGQKRFDFLWPVIASGAVGGILLLDCSRKDWINDYRDYVKCFSNLHEAGALVVALNRSQDQARDAALIDEESAKLDLVVPFFFYDPRKKKDVYEMLETLVMYAQLDNKLYGE